MAEEKVAKKPEGKIGEKIEKEAEAKQRKEIVVEKTVEKPTNLSRVATTETKAMKEEAEV